MQHRRTLLDRARRTTMVVGALAVLLFGSGCDDEPPVEIGAVLPLTGPASSVGEEVRDGLLLAIDAINARGGLDGRPIALVVEDGAGEADVAQSAFQRIAAREPLLVVSGTSAVALTLKPLAAERKVVLVGLVAAAPAFTEDAPWAYRYWPTAEQEVPQMADIVSQGLGSLAVLYLDDPYGRSVYANVARRFADTGTEVVTIPFPLNAGEMDDAVTLARGTEAAIIVGFAGHIQAVLRALDKDGYEGQRVSTTTATLPAVVAEPTADGTFVVAPAIYNDNYGFTR